MKYLSNPIRTGMNEWSLTNISAEKIAVEGVVSCDGVGLPFLRLKNGPQSLLPGETVAVQFLGSSFVDGFNGLSVRFSTSAGRRLTVSFPHMRV